MQGTALVAAVQNDGPFLLEWVAYHRLIGFERIVLFVDHGADDAGDLLDALADAGQITLVSNPRKDKTQAIDHRMRAYGEALEYVQDCTWVLALDTDEFLNIDVGEGRLDDLLDAAQDADLVSLTWRIFGQSDQWTFENEQILPRFLSAAPRGVPRSDLHKGIKTLFRPGADIEKMMPHRPRLNTDSRDGDTPLAWVDGNGDDVSAILRTNGWALPEGGPAYGMGQINKYPIRSCEVFALTNLWAPEWRLAVPALELDEFAMLDTAEERDLSILRWDDQLRAALIELLENPAIVAGQAKTVAAYQTAIAAMRKDAPAEIMPLLDPDIGKPQRPAPAPRPAPVAKPKPAAPAKVVATPDPAPTPDPTSAPEPAAEPPADFDEAPRWLADLRRSDHRRGFYHSDEKFAAQFTDRNAGSLLVSFDNLSNVGDKSLTREGWGYPFYRSEGWSHLGVMAFEKNWYRDAALFDYMEDLAARGFFKGYDNVMFTGTSMGAYAATAFCQLHPGSTVAAFSPQSTLDSKIVPWEERFGSGRKQDWSGRYADATTCIAEAKAIYMIYDPYFKPDRLHAERYQGPNVHYLKSWYASHKTALFMNRAQILKPVVRAALTGELTQQSYYTLYRERRKLPWYLNGLCDHLLGAGHDKLAAGLAQHLIDEGRPQIGRAMQNRVASQK